MMITANVSEIFCGTSSILRALHSHNTSNNSEANIIVIIPIYNKNTEVVGGYLHPLERELNWKRPEFEYSSLPYAIQIVSVMGPHFPHL